jgi:hypothetical protein
MAFISPICTLNKLQTKSTFTCLGEAGNSVGKKINLFLK